MVASYLLEPGGLYAEFCNPDESGPVTIYLGPTLPAGSSGLPEDGGGLPLYVPLFGLAPGGVCTKPALLRAPVRSYRTISPLPRKRGGMFLWHFPSSRLARELPGTLPGGARTFLPPGKPGRRPPSPLAPAQVYRMEPRSGVATSIAHQALRSPVCRRPCSLRVGRVRSSAAGIASANRADACGAVSAWDSSRDTAR